MEIDRTYKIRERTFVDSDGKTRSRYGSRGHNQIAWIVVHYTGSRTANGRARSIAKSMSTWKRAVSTHYFVGDDGIYQMVDERHAAWHVGGYCAQNKCAASNGVSIGVDLVEHKQNMLSGSVIDNDWYFSETVMALGAELVAQIADRYHVAPDHIVRHYDVTGKWCPRPFVGNDINEVSGETGEFTWQKFLIRVESKRAG